MDRQYIIAQVTDFPALKIDQKTKDTIFSPSFLMLGGLALILAWVFFSGDSNNKNKLGNAHWGGDIERRGARKKGLSQIKKPTRNKVCLYVNKPQIIKQKERTTWKKKGVKPPIPIKKGTAKTFFLPDCQRGTVIIGGAGSGKTYSMADPMARSAVDQGFPVLLYDFKYPAQTSRIAAYAKARGYNLKVFAPGFKESSTINILEFIRDEDDSVQAGQMAQVINKNISDASSSGGDKFFEDAGNSLVEGIFLLTKAIPKLLAKWRPQEYAEKDGITPNELAKSFDDLMTCQQLLGLSDIAKRLIAAQENGVIGNWTSVPLTQVMGSADAEKTVASIVATALRVFTKFLKKSLISSFVGKTDIDLDIDGKQLIVFGTERKNRDIISPLVATILHMVITRNVTRITPRKDPLCTFLDEIPSLYLPSLVELLAENREDGFVGVLTLQNIGQLEKRYGKEVAQIILSNCSTKAIFNPQEIKTAEMLSKLLGDREITYTTKSKSNSKGGGSRSVNYNKQAKPLIAPSEINQLGEGRCIILNPNYKRKEKSYIPMIQTMQICEQEKAHQTWSKKQWPLIQQHLISSKKNNLANSKNQNAILDHMITERRSIAKGFFPPAKPKEKIAA